MLVFSNDLRNNLKTLWNHRVRRIRKSVVNMAVSCPHTFSLRSHNSKVLPLVTRGLLPHVLKSIHRICLHSMQLYGVLKNSKGGGGIIQISQKEKLFQSHKKLRAIWGNLTLYHPSLPLSKKTFLFPSSWPSREYTWHLIEKKSF